MRRGFATPGGSAGWCGSSGTVFAVNDREFGGEPTLLYSRSNLLTKLILTGNIRFTFYINNRASFPDDRNDRASKRVKKRFISLLIGSGGWHIKTILLKI
jgi:hypothetical protein